MKIIGITGTCGKSTTAMIMGRLLKDAGLKRAVIGTMGAYLEDEFFPTVNTTPAEEILQGYLERMRRERYDYLVLEVSSHGVQQERIRGIDFDLGVFTNFSRDHIGAGEHQSLEEYFQCKEEFFRRCRRSLINCDDPRWEEICRAAAGDVITYGRHSSDYRLEDVRCLKDGEKLYTSFALKGRLEGRFKTPMIGAFNAYNYTAAMAGLREMGVDLGEDIAKRLCQIYVEGRTQVFRMPAGCHVIIDYAHNERELQSLVDTVRGCPHYEKIISVFGAGGNRSKDRRSMYGRVMDGKVDLLVLTADNPRYEELKDINRDIIAGFSTSARYLEIDDREEAIKKAVRLAGKKDVVLLIGKGHETYIEIKGKKFPFSELELIQREGGVLVK